MLVHHESPERINLVLGFAVEASMPRRKPIRAAKSCIVHHRPATDCKWPQPFGRPALKQETAGTSDCQSVLALSPPVRLRALWRGAVMRQWSGDAYSSCRGRELRCGVGPPSSYRWNRIVESVHRVQDNFCRTAMARESHKEVCLLVVDVYAIASCSGCLGSGLHLDVFHMDYCAERGVHPGQG